jgi:pimeloyl-ACP methyl ester carboxylesterase
VIVLPGRGDDLGDLEKTGIAAAVQKGWPAADVLLAGVTFGYYADGGMPKRLHDEVVVPALRRGYQEIWLAGASMGGMGALLYERMYPGEVTGLVLLAPYMGEPELIRQVAAAGGPVAWDPGPAPAVVGPDNYQPELWRLVKGWQDPRAAARIWLVCGDRDRLLGPAKLMGALLPADHFIVGAGGHDWQVWDAGATQVFSRIAAAER